MQEGGRQAGGGSFHGKVLSDYTTYWRLGPGLGLAGLGRSPQWAVILGGRVVALGTFRCTFKLPA